MVMKRSLLKDVLIAGLLFIISAYLGEFILSFSDPYLFQLRDSIIPRENILIDLFVAFPISLVIMFFPAFVIAFVLYRSTSKNTFSAILVGLLACVVQFIIGILNFEFH